MTPHSAPSPLATPERKSAYAPLARKYHLAVKWKLRHALNVMQNQSSSVMGRPKSPWTALSNHLKKRSAEICADNHCTIDGEHNCESYAYILADGNLLDICVSDYFQGTSKPHAAIPLPWNGCGRDLRQAVENDCEGME